MNADSLHSPVLGGVGGILPLVPRVHARTSHGPVVHDLRPGSFLRAFDAQFEPDFPGRQFRVVRRPKDGLHGLRNFSLLSHAEHVIPPWLFRPPESGEPGRYPSCPSQPIWPHFGHVGKRTAQCKSAKSNVRPCRLAARDSNKNKAVRMAATAASVSAHGICRFRYSERSINARKTSWQFVPPLAPSLKG